MTSWREQDYRDRLNLERQEFRLTWPLKLCWVILLLAVIGLGVIS